MRAHRRPPARVVYMSETVRVYGLLQINTSMRCIYLTKIYCKLSNRSGHKSLMHGYTSQSRASLFACGSLGKTQLVPPVRHGRTTLLLRFRYGSYIQRLNEVKVHRMHQEKTNRRKGKQDIIVVHVYIHY
jgi:hypothetical protein